MTRIHVLENKISFIKEQLHTLETFKSLDREKIESDKILKGSLERYLYLAIQGCIDLAEAYISLKNLRKPCTQSEAFEILHEVGVLELQQLAGLVKMVGMRNIIAHAYQSINYDMIFVALNEKLGDIEDFIAAVSRNL